MSQSLMEDLLTHLLKLEEKAWNANKNRDAEFFRNYMHDDGLVVTSFGVINKEQAIKEIENNPRELLHFEIKEPNVITLSDNSALLNYKVNTESSLEGEKGSFYAIITTVYVKKNKNWRAIFHQHSPLEM